MKSPDKRVFFRVSVAAVGLVALLAISFIVWRVNLAHDVNAKLQAIRAAGLPTSGAELNAYYHAVPDNENAALVMTQAFALMRNYPDSRSNEIDQIQSFPERWQHPTNEQIQLLTGYVEMNSNALAKMVEALKLPKSRYPIDLSPGFDALLPHLAKLRHLAITTEFKGLLSLNAGHPTDADVSIENILGIARTLDDEPSDMSWVVRVRTIMMASMMLERRLNASSGSDLELAELASMFAAAGNTNLFARTHIGVRANAIPYFGMTWTEINGLTKTGTRREELANELSLPAWQRILFPVTSIFERDLRYFLGAMETDIALTRLPPPRNLIAKDELTKAIEEAARHHYHLSVMFLQFPAGFSLEAECSAHVCLATTALAIERFRLAHGRLPENLNELVPQFLSAVPSDPFDGQPLRYPRLAKGYVIYSIGRDGHDDGGQKKPADWRPSDKTTYDVTFTVER
ncbi:MAG: hypothetical protein ABSH11_03450 [Verrucomicrobiota bacterium]